MLLFKHSSIVLTHVLVFLSITILLPTIAYARASGVSHNKYADLILMLPVGHTHSGIGIELDEFHGFSSVAVVNPHLRTTALKHAMAIIQRLKVTTCGVEAADRLWAACKLLGNDTDIDATTNVKHLDLAKSLYAVRASICETQSGGAKVPSPCYAAMNFIGDDVNSQKIVQIDLSTAEALKPCIGNLQKEHFRWTSYSNNLRDASTLCGVSRFDIEQQRVLGTYRDLTTGVIQITNLIEAQQQTAEQWISDAIARGNEIENAHTQTLNSMSAMYQDQTAVMVNNFENLLVHANKATFSIDHLKEATDRILKELGKDITQFGDDVTLAKENIARIYTGASMEVTAQLNYQLKELEVAQSLMQTMFELLQSHDLQKHNEDLTSLMTKSIDAFEVMYTMQDKHIAIANQQHDISQHTMLHLRSTLDMSQLASRSIQETSEHIDKLTVPIKALGHLHDLYSNGFFRSSVLEFCYFALMSCTSGLIFMISGKAKWALIVFGGYIWFQCVRIIFWSFHLDEAANKLLDFINLHLHNNPLLLPCILSVIGACIAIFYLLKWYTRRVMISSRIHKQNTANRKCIAEQRAAISRYATGLQAVPEDEEIGNDNVSRRTALLRWIAELPTGQEESGDEFDGVVRHNVRASTAPPGL